MAHTFLNLGFEDAGPAPGLADEWEFDQLSTLELLAEYGPTIPGAPLESFEGGWDSNEDYLLAFEGLLVDVFPAIYNEPGAPTALENFDSEWGNTFFATDFGDVSSDVALYDAGTPEGVEDFEEEWDSNEDYKNEFVGVPTDLTLASFDSLTPELVEDFEDEWAGQPGLTELSDVLFEIASLSVSFVATDTVTRASGSFIVDGVRAGGKIQFFGGVDPGNAGILTVKSVSALSMTVDITVTVEGPVSTTMRNVGFASFDGGPEETFEVTWTAMSTPF